MSFILAAMALLPALLWDSPLAAPVAAGGMVCAILLYGLQVTSRWRLRHLPGPKPSLFFGNLRDLTGRNLWEVMSEWSMQYGGIYRFFNGRVPVVVISDPTMAQEVLLKKFKVFHNRVPPPLLKYIMPKSGPRIDANMVWAKDKDWVSVRSAVQPFFHAPELKSYLSDMKRSASRLSDVLGAHAASGEPADMRKYFGAFALEVVGTSAFGVDFKSQTPAGEEQEELVTAATSAFNEPGGIAKLVQVAIFCFPWLAPVLGLVLLAARNFSKVMKEAFEQRFFTVTTAYLLFKNAEKRITGDVNNSEDGVMELPWGEGSFDVSKHSYKDVVPVNGSLPDLLMKGKHKLTGEPLTYAQMVAQSHVLLLAGYDTSANCLSYCTYLLAKYPEEQDKVVAELRNFTGTELTHEALAQEFPYTRAVVDEALRMFPPAPGTMRQASDDTYVGEGKYFIPKGTEVRISIFHMHRDPQLFPDPEVFKPSRFLKDSPDSKTRHQYAYLPFGGGPRMCIGFKFALQEIMLGLLTLLRTYSFVLDPGHDQSELKTKGLITMSPKDGVWVKVSHRAEG